VLDVLIPDVHPEAFLDFSNFLEALGTRPGLGIPDVTWASSFADRSRHASASSSQQISTPSGRLLHSVDRPIVHQIAEICAAKGGAKAMTVLSPFHDRDGSAVLELARVTGCQDIRIGLPPDPKLLSTFPFPTAQGWGLQLKAVRPSVDDAIRRPLHAKWIEIETPTGVFTITGSVNATSAALCSTRNVEVGVVRLAEAEGSKWEDAPIPTEIDQKPFTPGLASGKVSVHASLTGSGEIHGRLIPDSAVEGTWQLTLERLGNILAELPAQVDQSGAFRVTFAGMERLIEAGSVRITVARADKRGAGWLEMEELLRMPAEQRSVFSALLRYMTNQANEQDDIALLDYLAISAARHFGAFKPDSDEKLAKQRGAQVSAPTELLVAVNQFAPDQMGARTTPPRTFSEGDGLDVLQQWFRRFRRTVLSPSRSHGQAGNNPVRGSAEDEEEAAEQQRVVRSFDAFQDGMIRALSQPDITDADKRAGSAIWFDVSTHMLCHRLGDIPGAVVFLRRWLARTTELVYASVSPKEIERYVFAVSAILAQFAKSEESSGDLRLLHETLERFCRGPVSRDYAIEAVDRAWAEGLGAFLLGGEQPDLDANIDLILSATTSLKDLKTLLEAVHRGEVIPRDSRIFFGRDGHEDTLGRDLRAVLIRRDRHRYLRERTDDNFGLSCCHLRFSSAAAAEYRNRRIARCSMCNRFNLRLRP